MTNIFMILLDLIDRPTIEIEVYKKDYLITHKNIQSKAIWYTVRKMQYLAYWKEEKHLFPFSIKEINKFKRLRGTLSFFTLFLRGKRYWIKYKMSISYWLEHKLIILLVENYIQRSRLQKKIDELHQVRFWKLYLSSLSLLLYQIH